ncbi:MAG TPA: tRNA pseudouridine(55) synthase TruB [Puia sp.]|nr:tRNA pseudouridine(55) synthase TruB [Puia sp.]
MEQKTKNIYEEGQVLLINKPLHWTSADVTRKLRNLAKAKTGHAGTLDPLATGLLIICTGKFTKRINEFMAQEKEYTGSFTLGSTTTTFDLESQPENFKDFFQLTREEIGMATRQFTGTIMQTPPSHSAVKKAGKRAYELAREGKDPRLEPRQISIREFEITSIELPTVYFRVVCSTGTYIRSLANDMGIALGCGAHLSSLCRTRIGSLTLDQSMTMEEAEAVITKNLVANQKSE